MPTTSPILLPQPVFFTPANSLTIKKTFPVEKVSDEGKLPPVLPSVTKPLHIVLVTETWLPDINGVANSLYQLMRQLKQMGHRITLIRPRQTDDIEQQIANAHLNNEASRFNFFPAIDEQITVKGVPIPYYANLRMGMPNFAELKNRLKALAPDIVHIATEGPLGLQAWRASRKLGIKVTTGYHTAFHDFSRHFVGQRQSKGKARLSLPVAPLITPVVSSLIMGYLRYLHNRCHATCVPSEKTRDELANLGFKRLTIVGRGVDKWLFSPTRRNPTLRQSWGAGEQTTVLMYVGRVSPEKGIDTVIKAFRALQLAQLHRDITLVIVGDGPDKERLIKENQGNANIIFAGFQTGVELAEHYASGDAFVFASQVETFGNVVTEAMASGVPVFAYHDAAAGMLVDSQCGQTVKVGDETAFIDMIANLPKQHQLHAMRAVAEAKVADFGWQAPAEAMQAMFYQVLGVDYQAQKKAMQKAVITDKINPEATNTITLPKPIFSPLLSKPTVG